jgi:hypothetical protein
LRPADRCLIWRARAADAAVVDASVVVISREYPQPDYVFGHYVRRFGDVTLLLSDSLPVNHLKVSSKYLYKASVPEIPDASRFTYCHLPYFDLF